MRVPGPASNAGTYDGSCASESGKLPTSAMARIFHARTVLELLTVPPGRSADIPVDIPVRAFTDILVPWFWGNSSPFEK